MNKYNSRKIKFKFNIFCVFQNENYDNDWIYCEFDCENDHDYDKIVKITIMIMIMNIQFIIRIKTITPILMIEKYDDDEYHD